MWNTAFHADPLWMGGGEGGGLIVLNPPVINTYCPFLHALDHLLVSDAEFFSWIQQGGHYAVLGVSVNHSSSPWKKQVEFLHSLFITLR